MCHPRVFCSSCSSQSQDCTASWPRPNKSLSDIFFSRFFSPILFSISIEYRIRIVNLLPSCQDRNKTFSASQNNRLRLEREIFTDTQIELNWKPYIDCILYFAPYFQVTKNIVLQWGELPTSVAYIGTGQIMGWGNKAIEIRSVETGHLDGVFMHKKAQKLKFLCERNDKVEFGKRAITDGELTDWMFFRYSSQVLRAVLHVKSTSWPSTSLGWPIGDPLASNTLCIIVTSSHAKTPCMCGSKPSRNESAKMIWQFGLYLLWKSDVKLNSDNDQVFIQILS